jgi:hypothetical protein
MILDLVQRQTDIIAQTLVEAKFKCDIGAPISFCLSKRLKIASGSSLRNLPLKRELIFGCLLSLLQRGPGLGDSSAGYLIIKPAPA